MMTVDQTWADAAGDALYELSLALWKQERREPNKEYERRIYNRGGFLVNLYHSKDFDPIAATEEIKAIGISAMGIAENLHQYNHQEMVDLLCRKQADYGHGNILKFGVRGLITRMSDKIERWRNLSGEEANVVGEPAVDAILDLIGYAVIAIMLYNGTFTLPSPKMEA